MEPIIQAPKDDITSITIQALLTTIDYQRNRISFLENHFKTLLSSDKQEIVIGFDSPFCVIGERINPTGRKLLAAEMAYGDYSRVIADAVAQVEAAVERARLAAERAMELAMEAVAAASLEGGQAETRT